jgi:aryl-alcohol dehydrogenase-like predicted oxidoreductase
LAHSPFGGPAISSRLARNPWLLDTGEFLGATTHQVALAALLGRSKVVVPIPGSAKPGRPLVLAAAANLRLAPELLPPPDQTSP